MTVTLKDIAQDVNVSLQTVSRILNSNKADLYSEVTQEKVRSSAEKLGYRLNTQAQGMRRGQSPCVGLLLTDTGRHTSVSSEILWSVQTRLNEVERHALLLMMPPEGVSSAAPLPPVLHTHLLDGILLNKTRNLSPVVSDALNSLSLPLITLNDMAPLNTIYPDDSTAAYMATNDYMDRGHRDIVYMDVVNVTAKKSQYHYSVSAREQGYIKAMREGGLTPRVWRPDVELNHAQRHEYVDALLMSTPEVTAILAYSYAVNGEYLMKIVDRQGKRIPDDISLKVFGAEPIWEWGMPIDMMLVPQATMAAQGVDMLMERIENPDHDIPSNVLSLTTRHGQTVANGPNL